MTHFKELLSLLTKRRISLRGLLGKNNPLWYVDYYYASDDDSPQVLAEREKKKRQKVDLRQGNQLLKNLETQAQLLTSYQNFMWSNHRNGVSYDEWTGGCRMEETDPLDVVSLTELFDGFDADFPRNGRAYLRKLTHKVCRRDSFLRRSIIPQSDDYDEAFHQRLRERMEEKYGAELLGWRYAGAGYTRLSVFLRAPVATATAQAFRRNILFDEQGNRLGEYLDSPTEEEVEFQQSVLAHYRLRKLSALL